MNELPWIDMRCDHSGLVCLREVRRAPRIVVPSCTPWEPGHAPLRVMTTLHYCELHKGEFNLDGYWTGAIKARLERVAKRKRPLGFRPDFEAARCEQVLVTTPEYRAFLYEIGLRPAWDFNVAA